MKKVFSFCLICLFAVSAMAQDYVDLGLPSGTLWKRQNESGFYTYEEALNRFGNKLPEKHHYVELINECTWIWLDSWGYQVVGPNGNYILLPPAGYRYCDGDVDGVNTHGCYWSSTPIDSGKAWGLYLNVWVEEFDMNDDKRCYGQSVRLVQ